MPPLVIVNVPPVSSSICSVPLARTLPKSRIEILDLRKTHRLGVAKDGHHEPASVDDRDADVEELVVDDVVVVDRRVDSGNWRSASTQP